MSRILAPRQARDSAVLAERTCEHLTCSRRPIKRGLCEGHYSQFKTGRPLRDLRPRLTLRMTLLEKYAHYVVTSTDGCWAWSGPTNTHGYGVFQHEGRQHSAHRVSLEQKIGRKLSSSEVAMHLCDNPPCSNPSHLRVGDASLNRLDCVSKDRHTRGSRSPQAKLTESDIPLIRSAIAAGVTLRALSKEFGVAPSVVRRIGLRQAWRHV